MAKQNLCTNRLEAALRGQGLELIAGVDEVGRGALAGPVLAAAVILDLNNVPDGLNDSKQLTARQRKRLAIEIEATAIAIAIAQIEAREIDRLNIHQASLKAMQSAIMALDPPAQYLLIDGFALKRLTIPQQAIIKGDTLSVSIAAASIIAKVKRDAIMQEYEQVWPGYGFMQNVGYGTKAHLSSLARLGPTPIHRRSFQGVIACPQLPLPLD